MIATWQDADKAYQLHHIACPDCLGAGRRPGQTERCPEGEALWTQYLDQFELENPRPQRRPVPRRMF